MVGIHFLVYMPPYHPPGYTPARPPCHTGHRWSTAGERGQALERAVS